MGVPLIPREPINTREELLALAGQLYDELVREGFEIDHHESDLYVKDSPLARDLIQKYGLVFKPFTDDIKHEPWLDVPFSYAPWWREKGNPV